MTIGVYAVVNKHNGKRYIGSSSQIELRLRNHRCAINCAKFRHYEGYAEDAKKYGISGFEFVIVKETGTVEEARAIEAELLRQGLNMLYNKAPSVDGATGIKRQREPYLQGAAKRLADPAFTTRLSEACKGKRQIVKCPHCGLEGGGGNMRRYHFDGCKAKQ